MSFRGKVKAVLRVNESERLRRRDQAHGLQGEDAEMAAWNALSDAQKERLRRQAIAKKKVKKKVKKVNEAKKVKGVRGGLKPLKAKKVKRPVEAKKVTVAQAHKIARARAEADVDPEVLRKRSPDYVPTAAEKKKWAKIVAQSTDSITPESITDNSDHPFYQKVKELSRGKKNKSLLEKKSNSIKTFKILLGTVGKKSKTDESLAGGVTSELGAMGVRALTKLWKKRKSNNEKMDEGKREQAAKKRRDIAKKTDARRKQRAAEERRAREAQSELVKKGRRSDQEPNSPGHDATHGDSDSRKTGNDTLNDLAKKLGIGGPFF